MGFWSWLTGDTARSPLDITPNTNPPGVPPTVGPDDYTPGDPDGFELLGVPVEARALPQLVPAPWDGWPSTWDMPWWNNMGGSALVDTAWTCLDLNSRVLAGFPRYKLRNGQVVEPESWMENPDPRIYSSWYEFAKQLFWEYQLGEAFILATDYFSSGWPMFFRVIPQSLMTVEMDGARRVYSIGRVDVTADILHIRYKSSTDQAHGIGPLEAGGARMTAASVMQQYTRDIVRNGGINLQTLETDQMLSEGDAQDISDQWVTSRRANVGRPPVLDAGVKLVDHQMSPKDMALIEISQFTDSRIAILLGVPPFLAGLPSGGDSMTYSNVSALFDYHDRSALKPFATDVMSALSQWALPRGSSVELNRDEYSRPPLAERANAYATLAAIEDETGRAITVAEIRAMERLNSATPTVAASSLTGGAP